MDNSVDYKKEIAKEKLVDEPLTEATLTEAPFDGRKRIGKFLKGDRAFKVLNKAANKFVAFDELDKAEAFARNKSAQNNDIYVIIASKNDAKHVDKDQALASWRGGKETANNYNKFLAVVQGAKSLDGIDTEEATYETEEKPVEKPVEEKPVEEKPAETTTSTTTPEISAEAKADLVKQVADAFEKAGISSSRFSKGILGYLRKHITTESFESFTGDESILVEDLDKDLAD